MENKPLVSYILPTYKAESFIYSNLRRFFQYCYDSEIASEIIVVNDGSIDRTGDEILRFMKDHNDNDILRYIELESNCGKGLAVKKGVDEARGDYVVFTDCDLPYSFINIRNVVDDLISGEANVVIASRMHEDSIYHITSGNLSYIYIRHTAGRIFNWLINLITRLNISDTQAGLKGFDRETAKLVFSRMTISGFSFDLDVLMCAVENNKKVSTVPVEFDFSEMSTVSFMKQVFIMSYDLLKISSKRLTSYYVR